MYRNKLLDKLMKMNDETPLYYDIETPVNLIKKYSDDEIRKLMCFDLEFKSTIEPFLGVCYNAKLILENIDFIELDNLIEDDADSLMFLREIKILNLFKDIAVYFEFIEIKSNPYLCYKSMSGIIKSIHDILLQLQNISFIKEDRRILNDKLQSIKKRSVTQSVNCSLLLKLTFEKCQNILDFKQFNVLFGKYCLTLIGEEKFLNYIDDFQDIFEIIDFLTISNEDKNKLKTSFNELNSLLVDYEISQRDMYYSQKR